MTDRRPWYFGPIVGAAVGLVILGAGSRVAMRQIAILSGASGAFTVEGTITVLLAGGASGVAGGIIRALTTIGGRLSTSARFLVFAAACTVIALRGLNPLDADRLLLFMPLIAAYVAAIEAAWRWLPWLRRSEPALSDVEPHMSGA